MSYKTKRSRATDIPQSVKKIVYERDGGRCIFCGAPGHPNAHIISRAHGGLGVEQNIITACFDCHFRMDNSPDRYIYLEAAKAYIRGIYGAIDDSEHTYRKGETWGR